MPDSGGAGRFRGGLAYLREFRVLAERAVLTIRSDRKFHPPFGLFGGAPGGPSRNLLVTAEGERDLPGMPMSAIGVRRGDTYLHVSAGGGGMGSPLERDPEAVLADVLDGKVTAEAARELYGVALDERTLAVDEALTAELRSRSA